MRLPNCNIAFTLSQRSTGKCSAQSWTIAPFRLCKSQNFSSLHSLCDPFSFESLLLPRSSTPFVSDSILAMAIFEQGRPPRPELHVCLPMWLVFTCTVSACVTCSNQSTQVMLGEPPKSKGRKTDSSARLTPGRLPWRCSRLSRSSTMFDTYVARPTSLLDFAILSSLRLMMLGPSHWSSASGSFRFGAAPYPVCTAQV